MTNEAASGFGERVKIFANDSSACGSITRLQEGKRTEMVFHLQNDKVVYVLAGQVRLIVIDEGVGKRQDLSTGASLSIKAGVVHQFEGITGSILVEFGTNSAAYTTESTDTRIVEKGSAAATVEEAPAAPDTPSVVMSEEDKAQLDAAVEKAEEELAEAKTTPPKKKRRRKKRVTKTTKTTE